MKSGASDPFSDEGDDSEDDVDGDGDVEPQSEVRSDGEFGEVMGGEGVDDVGGDASDSGRPEDDSNDGSSASSGRADSSSSSENDDSGASSDDAGAAASTGGGDGGGLDRSQIPYTLRRDNVKDERPHVHQLFVTDETDDAAREAERDLEDRLDTDVYRLDAREAIYRIGMRHPEEVAELLEEWGYNF